MHKNIPFFKGLNALRFFAAYLVVIHHIERIRLKYKFSNFADISIVNNGGIAVTFFFVLSGFLITYLLLKENARNNDINVKHFYVRRILRIWPLYFLLVFIGTLLIPNALALVHFPYEMPYTFWEAIPFFIFFMPFMVNILFGHSLLEPLWSIGVEELFYLMWAPLVKAFKKHIGTLLLTVFVSKMLLNAYVAFFPCPVMLKQVVSMLQFEAMAIGGAGAWWLYNAQKEVSSYKLFSKGIQIALLSLIVARLFFFQYLSAEFALCKFIFSAPLFSTLLMQATFCWLILNVSVNSSSLIRLDYKPLDFLGEISYGIYMYHMLVVFTIVLVFSKIPIRPGVVIETVIFYTVITGATVLVAYLSKKYFEDYFNRLRGSFL